MVHFFYLVTKYFTFSSERAKRDGGGKMTDFSMVFGRYDLLFELRPQYKSHTIGDVSAKFSANRS